jgi:hypothetical protein
MPDFAIGGLAVLDLCHQGRLDPNTSMIDALAVGLGFPYQRLEACWALSLSKPWSTLPG